LYQVIALIMEAVNTSETSIYLHEITKHNTTKGSRLHAPTKFRQNPLLLEKTHEHTAMSTVRNQIFRMKYCLQLLVSGLSVPWSRLPDEAEFDTTGGRLFLATGHILLPVMS
jgi:hypothetical protein